MSSAEKPGRGAKVTPIRSGIASHLREAGEAARPPGGGFLPDDCPVVPIGMEGDLCWYLDGVGQLLPIQRKGHNKNTIMGLFAPHVEYCQNAKKTWAKTIRLRAEEGEPERQVVVDFRPDAVARDLMAACAMEGPFRPLGRVRGRGVWRGQDDDLVLHHGDALEVRGQDQPVGKRGRWVYPRGPDRPRPAGEPQPGGAGGPAEAVLADLGRWAWARPEIDPRLLLGWLCATFLAGALEHRPHAWATGPRAAGKSTLTRYIARLLHEPAGCILTGDTTAAGVRSTLRDDSLAVLFDDAEAGETPDRVRSLVELMRAAATGANALRGTSEHGSASFTVRFMGFVNSILRPPMTAQDLSRMLLLQMRPLPADATPPAMGESRLGHLGRQMFRRMVDQWPRFLAELPRWQAALKQAGMPGRAPEQFGILLCAQDVALHDVSPDTDTLAEMAQMVADGTLSDRAEEMAEWQRCLELITSTIVPSYRGGQQRTLGHMIAVAAMERVWRDQDGGEDLVAPAPDRDDAARALGGYGLRVVPMLDERKRVLRHWRHDPRLDPSAEGDGRLAGWLAIANSHAALNDAVFRRSHYAKASGTSGGWKAALETADGVIKGREMRFGGPASRCVLVPLHLVLDGGDRIAGSLIE